MSADIAPVLFAERPMVFAICPECRWETGSVSEWNIEMVRQWADEHNHAEHGDDQDGAL